MFGPSYADLNKFSCYKHRPHWAGGSGPARLGAELIMSGLRLARSLIQTYNSNYEHITQFISYAKVIHINKRERVSKRGSEKERELQYLVGVLTLPPGASLGFASLDSSRRQLSCDGGWRGTAHLLEQIYTPIEY